MTTSFQVILDACVLVNAALRDTLLRLAEPPELYLPRWSHDIADEVRRTLEKKLALTQTQTQHLFDELLTHFGDAWVQDYAPLIPAMNNHPKDRHVLAAAVRTGAQIIVTFNLKDFPEEALTPWNISAQSPEEFLIHQFHLAPAIVARKLLEQSQEHGGVQRLMEVHGKTVPRFVALVRPALDDTQLLRAVFETE